ncbi:MULTISPECIES: Rieske 2Fe-2S domain-containing protein [Aerosakkonema]|uniref:Rieske 2Fe-2S domain-containing protein n=1 Tax=Aerosakkonema TaxID=1246629 RepID=UPI0035B8E4CD
MIAADPILLNDWHPVAKVEDCPPGKILTTRLLGEDLVLWRPLDPQAPVQAWQDRCPHRGAPLSLGKVGDRTLACVYHGWEYDPTGKCVLIPPHPALEPPAGARIKTYHCRERYGAVWVCLGTPSADVPPFPEWDEPNCLQILSEPIHGNASGFRLVEIGIDFTHFRYLHNQTECNPQVHQDFQVEMTTDGITVCERHFPDADSQGKRVTYTSSSSMKIPHPLRLYSYIEITQGPYKGRFAFLTAITPVEEEKSVQWSFTATNMDKAMLPQWLVFNQQVQQEDVWMAERLQPKRMPLIPPTDNRWPADLHVPSDRSSLTYRKWLKQIGVTYGVC